MLSLQDDYSIDIKKQYFTTVLFRVLLFTLVLPVSKVQAQSQYKTIIKHTYYSEKGMLAQINFDTVLVNGPLDAEDLKQYHLLFDLLPNSALKGQAKDTSFTVWKDISKSKLEGGNFGLSYTYDKQGLLSKYCYSGCILCASSSYCLLLSYDPKNRIASIKRAPFLESTNGDVLEMKFFYTERDEISEVFVMSGGALKECLQVQH